MTTALEPSAWDGRFVFNIRCKCKTVFASKARILLDAKGPNTVTEKPCPECGSTTSAMHITTEKDKA